MNSKQVDEEHLPAWISQLKYNCPRCRRAMIQNEARPPRCESCGFQARIDRGVYSFVVPTDSIDEWQNTYEKLATSSLGNTSMAVQYRSPLQQHYVVNAFRDLCSDLNPDARILDVGCGNGIFWEKMLDARPALGVDYSVGMCVLARQRGLLAFQADALALPFADEEFDLVYSAGLLEHMADLPALCAELARVCRPGGRIVVGSGNRVSLARQAMRLARKVKPHPVDSKNPPTVMWTAADIAATARQLPLEPEMACWTHFPLPWRRCSRSLRGILTPLASNVVVRLKKLPQAENY